MVEPKVCGSGKGALGLALWKVPETPDGLACGNDSTQGRQPLGLPLASPRPDVDAT